jgi:hypothetical protein
VTPEQEEQVRRALAAAAAQEGSPTMPPEVVTRLDGVLDELAAPRRAARAPHEVADEVTARRRRRWPQVLVAAAAVSVVGLAGAAVVTDQLTGSGSGSSSAGSASSTDDGGGAAAGQGARGTEKGPVPSEVPEAAGGDGSSDRAGPPPELRTATLGRDVERVLAGRGAFALRGRGLSGPAQGQSSAEGNAATCAVPATRRGDRLLAVRLDGQAATLVVGPVRQGARVARVYACDRADAPAARTVVRP